MKKSVRLVSLAVLLVLMSGVVAFAGIPEGWERVSHPTAVSGEADGLDPAGDRHNSYAWCQGVLGDYLYVGSNRDMLSALGSLGMPVGSDPEITPPMSPDGRARIFRYKLDGTEDWEIAYIQEPIFASGDVKLGCDYGYRGMEVFSPEGEASSALYVVNYPMPALDTIPGMEGIPAIGYPRVLRIGTDFDPASDTPEEVLRLSEGSLRSTAVYGGRIFIGNTNLDIWASSNPQVQAPGGSGIEGWVKVADSSDFPGYKAEFMDNPTVPGVWDMISYNGCLYAFLGEPMGAQGTQGFLVYKGRKSSDGPEEWEWTEIVGPAGKYEAGMGYKLNMAATPYVFDGHVYVGTFTNHPSWMMELFVEQDIVGFLNDAAPPQIYRFDEEDNWEMVVGDPHMVEVNDVDTLFTAIGNCRGGFYRNPVEGLLPEDLDPALAGIIMPNLTFNSYIWRFASFEGKLYCTTFDQRDGMERVFDGMLGDFPVISGLLDLVFGVMNDNPGGFDLYATEDGLNWSPLTRDGFGDVFNYGGRSFGVASDALFLGTSNPSWGCQVWKYASEVADPALPGDGEPSGDENGSGLSEGGTGSGGGCRVGGIVPVVLLMVLPLVVLKKK